MGTHSRASRPGRASLGSFFVALAIVSFGGCRAEEARFEGVGEELILSPSLIELEIPADPPEESQPAPKPSAVTLAIRGLDEYRLPSEGAHVDVCIGPCGFKTDCRGKPPGRTEVIVDPTPYARFVQTPLDADGRGCTVLDGEHLAHCVLPASGVATVVVESKGRKFHGREGSLFVEAVSLRRGSENQWLCAMSWLQTGAGLPEGASLSIVPKNAELFGETASVACGQYGSCGQGVRELAMWVQLEGEERPNGMVSGTFSISPPPPGADAWVSSGSCEDDRHPSASFPFHIWQNQDRSQAIRVCTSGKPGSYKVVARIDPEHERDGAVHEATATITDHGEPSGLLVKQIATEEFGSSLRHKVEVTLVNCAGKPIPGIRGIVGGLPIDEDMVVDPDEGPVRIEWPTGEATTSLRFWVASADESQPVLPIEWIATDEVCSFALRAKEAP